MTQEDNYNIFSLGFIFHGVLKKHANKEKIHQS